MKRYSILFASILIQVCIGGLYAWSAFVPALKTDHGLSTAQTQLIFGGLIMVFTVSMVFAGRLLNRLGPARTALIGGLFFGSGYWVASLSGGNVWALLLGVSLLAGTGTGFCYVCPLTVCAKWFPAHKGLVTGIAVAGFGGGAVVLTYLNEMLLGSGYDVLGVFGRVGLIYGLVILVAALFLRFPAAEAASSKRIAFAILGRDRYFWGLCLGIFVGTFAGLLVIGNLKPMVLARGASTSTAALAISVFAAGNAVGRIAWGWIADRLRGHTVWLSLIFLAIPLILSLVCLGTPWGALIIPFLLGTGFGACFIVYAAQTGFHYGVDNVGTVYPLIFLAYGLSGLLGPWVGGRIYDVSKSYDGALYVSIVLVLVGAAVSSLLLRSFKSPSS
jgi:MFS transporter, OFA family, oxalate/formate antiporter